LLKLAIIITTSTNAKLNPNHAQADIPYHIGGTSETTNSAEPTMKEAISMVSTIWRVTLSTV
jgi:hypothetical protein